MLNYILNVDSVGNVGYLMENGEHPVTAIAPFEAALMMLCNGGEVRLSSKHKDQGYILTSDDRFFFDGDANELGSELKLSSKLSSKKRCEHNRKKDGVLK